MLNNICSDTRIMIIIMNKNVETLTLFYLKTNIFLGTFRLLSFSCKNYHLRTNLPRLRLSEVYFKRLYSRLDLIYSLRRLHLYRDVLRNLDISTLLLKENLQYPCDMLHIQNKSYCLHKTYLPV